jgi:subtilisin family serine protease
MGVGVERDVAGGPRLLGTVARAEVTWDALARLSEQPDIARIEALWLPSIEQPLEVTTELVGVPSARRRPLLPSDGARTTIAVIDTGIDVLHPFFFHADGGYYRWIDTDRNGVFDPGVDAVDLDDDGVAARNEILRVLDATTVVDFGAREFENDDGILQPSIDWLYADMNGDRRRNVGVEAGFNEETPAYGEAIFVVDDVDGDGSLSADERLVRLETSKIRKYVSGAKTYQRGDNLIAAGEEAVDDALHGSGSAGVLVGGQPGFHTRVGVAPAADLLVYGLGSVLVDETSVPLEYLEMAVDDGADVVLHEWTNAFSQPLDGSTNFEAAMSAARDDGVVQVNPAGNLNLSNKHVQRVADAGDVHLLGFEVGEGFEDGDELLAYRSVFGSLQWRADHALEVTLESPSGERVELGTQMGSAQIGSSRIDAVRERTSRGTTVWRFFLEAGSEGGAIEQGQWTFEVSGFEHPDTIYGRITDAYSNWRPGVIWSEPSAGVSTLAFPATADAAVGVSAYAARRATPLPDGAQIGELRGFSGRGPRIDGAQAIDIAAPDDPFVPLAATPGVLEAEWGRSWFTQFGGTSGASPHVAASIALLRQQYPEWSPDQLEAQIFETASTDGLMPQPGQLPGSGWGHGKLDVYRAIFNSAPAPNTPPHAVLEVSVDGNRVVWDASQSSDPDGDALKYRFDVDYDGAWDSEWMSQPRFSSTVVPGEVSRRQVARLEVRDTQGARGGALAGFDIHSAGGDGGMVDAGDAAAGPDAANTELENPADSCCSTAPVRRTPAPVHVGIFVGLMLAFCRLGRPTK